MVAKHAEDTVSPLYPTRSTTAPRVAPRPPNARNATAIALYTDVRSLTADSVAVASSERVHLEVGAVNAAAPTTAGRFAAVPPTSQRRRRHPVEHSG